MRGEAALEDYNQVSVPGPRTPLGIDAVAELPDGAGLRLAQVGSESLAEQAGLQPDDVILEMGGATVRTVEQARAVILEVRPGQDVPVTLQRGGAPLQLTLRFPATPPSMPRIAFPRRRTSGRVELTRTGNTVEAATRGVQRFTLLVSGDQFDLSQPIRVVVNGAVAHDAVVTPRRRDAAALGHRGLGPRPAVRRRDPGRKYSPPRRPACPPAPRLAHQFPLCTARAAGKVYSSRAPRTTKYVSGVRIQISLMSSRRRRINRLGRFWRQPPADLAHAGEGDGAGASRQLPSA